MLSVNRRQFDRATADLMAGLRGWRLSGLLAWQDIKQRYRRSTLGPIWLTLSSGVQMLTMSLVSSFLFQSPIAKAVPYVCAGMLFWVLITQLINDGAAMFVTATTFITQIKTPLTIFLVQAIWRNLIISAHNSVIYIIIALIFGVVPSVSIIALPIAVALVVFSTSWMMVFCAIISARFRDVPVIIQNVLNVGFWFTPLMYFPEQLGRNKWIVEYNPFTHMIALLREPLLGAEPSWENWAVVIGVGVVGWVGTFFFFARFRARVVYWL